MVTMLGAFMAGGLIAGRRPDCNPPRAGPIRFNSRLAPGPASARLEGIELFHKILKACVDAHASDVHAKVGHATVFRISRQLVAIDAPSPTPEWFDNVLSHIVPDHLREPLKRDRETDFSYYE